MPRVLESRKGGLKFGCPRMSHLIIMVASQLHVLYNLFVGVTIMGFNTPSTFHIHILCNYYNYQCCTWSRFKMADIPYELELSSAYHDNDWTSVN